MEFFSQKEYTLFMPKDIKDILVIDISGNKFSKAVIQLSFGKYHPSYNSGENNGNELFISVLFYRQRIIWYKNDKNVADQTKCRWPRKVT
jgi:hypothetical protein